MVRKYSPQRALTWALICFTEIRIYKTNGLHVHSDKRFPPVLMQAHLPDHRPAMNVKSSPPILDIRLQDTSPIASKRSLLREIATSLSKPYNEKTLPSLLLYDEVGLKLFEKITYEPEYYLTETEISILKIHARDIADTIPEECILVELGAG